MLSEQVLKFVSLGNIKNHPTEANPSPIRMIRYSDHETLMQTALRMTGNDSKEKIESLEKQLMVEARVRQLSLTKPAAGHDYWERFFQAKYEVEIKSLADKLEGQILDRENPYDNALHYCVEQLRQVVISAKSGAD